jgi:predicted RNA binding protein YcfA (HicA-like mRNA interferase family)
MQESESILKFSISYIRCKCLQTDDISSVVIWSYSKRFIILRRQGTVYTDWTLFIEKTIVSYGFVIDRISNSHFQLNHQDGRRVTIPRHNRIELGVIKFITAQLHTTHEEFLKNLECMTF